MLARSDLMEVCQTSSLLMLTLACFQKSCRHCPAGEGAFPKSVPKTSCGITQEKFGFLCTEQWSVWCMCEITSADVNLVSVFI